MDSCLLLLFTLGIPLLWPCLVAAENVKTKRAKQPAGSHWRVKRGWVWNQFFVPEELNTTHHIGRLRSDLDNGNNSFQYKLLGVGAENIFTIDGRTGDLYAKQKLDREERSLYILRAQVIDITTGKAVEPESEFVIRVSDINDNEPKFLDEPYEATVPEMSPEGTLVTQVTARDADDPSSGNHARLLYSLLQGQPYFSIEPTTGVIRISSKMDRELQDEYWVIVQAKDMIGQPGALSGTTSVLIKLSDVNDNKPIFKESLYRLTVSESAPTGTSIGRITAHDDDTGENAEMDYSIEEDDSQTFDIITNNETQEGIVILKKNVDYEQQNHYGIRAKVKNLHVDEQFMKYHTEASTTFIKVQVEDEDEPPVFLLPYYVFEIFEENAYGSFVGLVSATDPDHRKSPIRYSLTGTKLFHIDDNGTIITTHPLDREINAWYNLSVTATESYNVQQISSVPVYVQVLNINDHAPAFPQYYEMYVCENADSGQAIQNISAVDRDESMEDHHFYFNLSVDDTNNSSFTIKDNQDNTATILTNRTGFSLQEEPVFYVSILIADNGSPSLTSTNTLTIYICDCDENGDTQLCRNKELMLFMGIKTEVIIAILICIMAIFGFIFFVLCLTQRKKQTLFPEKSEDFRENIFRYDDEGGGEADTEAFDIAELRSRAVQRSPRPRRGPRAEVRSLRRQSLQLGPDSALFRKFILEKLEEANADPCAPPFDSLQTYAFEGTGSLAGSLSSLGSAVSDQDENYDYLQELGPRFKRLACMFGSTMQSNN
ncbi:cadherin-19 isoform X1 [Nycticebus coucang]|uniref:cadherin-19 isoform X1 n=1 Tax=Nycticebus coucang TaxID=9470 RepID=UPI00234CB8FC|nr:cadherin-19 isoform X1 [Nycticebus coucang]XP_053427535.1 cadherin-19 isoform X1 [Nycticebus coucang]